VVRGQVAIPLYDMTIPIYLDYHATTPVDQRVLSRMYPYFSEMFGNASSRAHCFGWQAEEAVGRARQQAAFLIGAMPNEIVFTSGATESNNLALNGISNGGPILTVATEHRSVLDVARGLRGETVYLPVGPDGLIDLTALGGAITPRTTLVSVMWANNEIGVIQNIREIGRITRDAGVCFHSDATQAVGKIPIDVIADQVDLLSFSAHKLYGPKGVGALYVRSDIKIRPSAQIIGGGQEAGMRSGTLNVPGIVGFGEACLIAKAEMTSESLRTESLRNRLRDTLLATLDEVYINGSLEHRIPNNLNVSFAGIDGQALIRGISEIAVSSGSACSSTSVEPSHVLRALGIEDERAYSAIRFGIGRFTTVEEIDYTAARIAEVVRELRGYGTC
jgi:cysteine desulfurase